MKTNLDYITENIKVIHQRNDNILESIKEFTLENLDTVEWWLAPDSKLTEDKKLLKHLIKRKSTNIRLIGADKYHTNNKTLILSKKLEKLDKIRKDFIDFKKNLRSDVDDLLGRKVNLLK